MAATPGNEFWKLRAKHGRDKIFSSPDLLWESACEYFQWCIDNPLMEVDYRGKDITEVKIPKMRAFTWSGLEFYLGISDLKNYKSNESYKDFFPVITRIEQVMYTQKFEGAAAGFLHPNIIARDLGLADKSEIKGEVSHSITIERHIYTPQPKKDTESES